MFGFLLGCASVTVNPLRTPRWTCSSPDGAVIVPDGVVEIEEKAGSLSRCEPASEQVLSEGSFRCHLCGERPARRASFTRSAISYPVFVRTPSSGPGIRLSRFKARIRPFSPFRSLGRPFVSFVPLCAGPAIVSSSMHPLFFQLAVAHFRAFPSAAKPLFRRLCHSRFPYVPGIPAMRILLPEELRHLRLLGACLAFLWVPWIPRGSLSFPGYSRRRHMPWRPFVNFKGLERKQTLNVFVCQV